MPRIASRAALAILAAVACGSDATADDVDFGLASLRVRVRRPGYRIQQTVLRVAPGGPPTAIGRIGMFHSVLPVGLRGPEHGVAWAASVNTADEPVLVVAGLDSVAEQTFSFGSTLGAVTSSERGFWYVRVHAAAGTRQLTTPYGAFDLPAAAPWEVHAAGGGAVFAYDGGDGAGTELWGVIAAEGELRRLADLNVGAASSFPADFAVVGSRVFFTADDGTNGREPYVVDADTGEVRSVGDLRPGPESSDAHALGIDLGALWISADDGTSGREPWRVVLERAEATLVELEPGPTGSAPTRFAVTRAGAWTSYRAPDGLVRVVPLRGSGDATVNVPQDVGALTYFLTTPRGRVWFVHDRAVASIPGERVLIQEADAPPESTTSDADGDGFTDDVEIAVGTDPADARRTPAGGARAGDAGDVELRSLRVGSATVDVTVVLPPRGEFEGPSEGLVVSAGGAVAGAYLGGRDRAARDGRSTLRRVELADGRRVLRVRIVGARRPRRDGDDGAVPVLVWRDAARHEARRVD